MSMLLEDVNGSSEEPSLAARMRFFEQKINTAMAEIDGLKAELEATTKEKDTEIKRLQGRLLVAEERLEISNLNGSINGSVNHDDIPWRRIGIQNIEKKEPDLTPEELEDVYKLPTDVYTTLCCWKWKTKPFWTSSLVVGVQILLLILLLLDQVEDGDPSNPLGVPENVSVSVRIAQAVAIIIALFDQEDLRSGIEGIFMGLPSRYKGDITFQQMSATQWYLAYLFKFLQGTLSLVSAFILAIKSTDVFAVLVNFLGVRFVSELDDLAFLLSELGYFGGKVQKTVKAITEAEFHKDGKSQTNSCIKKFAHVLGFFFVLMTVIFGFSYFAIEQNRGAFLVQYISVEFGDESIPYLGALNGCYKARNANLFERRLVYEQVGFETEGGKFGFCGDVDGSPCWTFFTGKEPCENYIARSGSTQTFDLMEAGAMQWYTDSGLPLEYLRVSQVFDNSIECGKAMFEASQDSCDELELDKTLDGLLGVRPRYYERIEVDGWDRIPDFVDATLSHPIYVGSVAEAPDRYDIVLYIGSRWILTDTVQLNIFQNQPDKNQSDISIAAIHDYFYIEKSFEILSQSDEWVLLISERVESSNDQGTPLGLQWFYPRYGIDNLFNFPKADLTQSEDVTFGCALCNNVTNPCYYQGVCQTNAVCECQHGASGALCRDTPVGNGVCDRYFNTKEHSYDGGDCCDSTCIGPACGISVAGSPFGLDSTAEYVNFFGSSFFGFWYCLDEPGRATFAIGFESFEYLEYLDGCIVGSLNIKCGDKTYLNTPGFRLDGKANCEQSYFETINVPYDTKCELSLEGDRYGIALFHGNNVESSPLPINEDVITKALTWTVPSECFTQILSKFTTNIFDENSLEGEAVGILSADGISAYLCIADPNLVLERFSMVMFLKAFEIGTVNWNMHQCHGLAEHLVNVECDEDDKIISLSPTELLTGGTIPTELGFLSDLEHLDLSDKSLSGTLPSEVGQLTKLLTLQTSNNLLTGSIPSEIGHLSLLTILDLSHNDFQGDLPSQIGKVEQLTQLYIDDNDLSGKLPAEVCLLENLSLSNITLSGNNFSLPYKLSPLKNLSSVELEGCFEIWKEYEMAGSISSEIGYLTDLRVLESWSPNIFGSLPTEIGRLTKLTSIDLDSSSLTGSIPTEFEFLSELTSLNLSNNSLTGTVGHLGNLQLLSELYLENNTLRGELSAKFCTMNLTHVGLVGNNFTLPTKLSPLTELAYYDRCVDIWSSNRLAGTISSEVGLLTQLTTFTSWSVNMTGTIPTEIGLLTNLVTIDLGQSNLSGTIPSQIEFLTELVEIKFYKSGLTGTFPTLNLTQLTVIDLHGNSLTGSLSSAVGQLNGLEYLDLSQNAFNGTIPSEIASMGSLKELNLNDNLFTGSLPSDIGGMFQLVKLHLAKNAFRSTLPIHFGNLTSLETLDVSNNRISGNVPAQIGKLSNLLELFLSSNQFSGPLPIELFNLVHLEKFYIDNNLFTGQIPITIENFINLIECNVGDNANLKIRKNAMPEVCLLSLNDHFSKPVV